MGRWIMLAVLAALAMPVAAEEVRQDYRGLTFNANLELAPGRAIKDGVVLIVHGTFAHNRAETIETAQRELLARGIGSLAINVSYGRNDRHGPFECGTLHKHSNELAVDETALWTGWLKKQGARWVVLMGHGRGGAHVTWYQGQWSDPGVKALVLLQPEFFDYWKTAKDYERRHGKPLEPIVIRAGQLVKEQRITETLTEGFLDCPNAEVNVMTFLTYYGDQRRLNNPSAVSQIRRNPILVIAAGKDPGSADLAAEMSRFLDAKKDRWIELPDVDGKFVGADAQAAADAVAKFLGDLGLTKN